MIFKKFEVRWSDLDANMHVANASYSQFFNETRMHYFHQHGWGLRAFAKHRIGPVLFAEQLFYISEVLPSEIVYADARLLGLSDDYRYMKVCHSLFREDGTQCVYSTHDICFISMETRKIVTPPSEMQAVLDKMPKAENFKVLEMSSSRNPDVPYGRKVNPSIFTQ